MIKKVKIYGYIVEAKDEDGQVYCRTCWTSLEKAQMSANCVPEGREPQKIVKIYEEVV